jgi:lysozyme-like protein
MPGMNLSGILSGLGIGFGQFADQQQKQQQDRQRTQMLQLELQKFQQDMQDRQQARQSSEKLWNMGDIGSISGGGGTQGSGGVGVPIPQATPDSSSDMPYGPYGGKIGGGSITSIGGVPRGGGDGQKAGGGLSLENMTQLATQAGFSPDKAPIIAAISMAESSGDPNAFNPDDPAGGSFGLTQINGSHPGAQSARGNAPRAMQLAYQVSKGGEDFSPWAAYTSGKYKSYLRPGGTGQGRTNPGDAAVAEFTPFPSQGGSSGRPITWTQDRPGPEAVAATSGPGAPSGNRVPGPGQFAPGFARGDDSTLTRNGQPPDTYIGGAAPGGGAVPAWQVSSTPGGIGDVRRQFTGGGGQSQTAQDGGSTPAGTPPQAGGAGAGVSPGDLQKRLNAIIPPNVNGGMNVPALKAAIDRACPGCPAVLKQEYLESQMKRLAPQEAEKLKIKMEQYKTQLGAVTKEWEEEQKQRDAIAADQRTGARWKTEHDVTRGETVADRDVTGGTLVTGQGGERYNVLGTKARPVTTPTGEPLTDPGRHAQSKNIEVTDGDGKIVFSGSAHNGPGGYISDKDQQLVPIPDDGNIKISGIGGQGKQAAQQIQSMIGASSELVGEARNLMELPSEATLGLFQGLQSTPAGELSDAVKRVLANKMTPEQNTDVSTSFQGVANALAQIEGQGRAMGLVGLREMSKGLAPMENDTLGNRLRKYATIRQLMERNMNAMNASPNITREQKAELATLREEMATVIPFTVSEVNKLQHGDKESVAQAARKFGLGPKGDAGAKPLGPGEVEQGGLVFEKATGKYLRQLQP